MVGKETRITVGITVRITRGREGVVVVVVVVVRPCSRLDTRLPIMDISCPSMEWWLDDSSGGEDRYSPTLDTLGVA